MSWMNFHKLNRLFSSLCEKQTPKKMKHGLLNASAHELLEQNIGKSWEGSSNVFWAAGGGGGEALTDAVEYKVWLGILQGTFATAPLRVYPEHQPNTRVKSHPLESQRRSEDTPCDRLITTRGRLASTYLFVGPFCQRCLIDSKGKGPDWSQAKPRSNLSDFATLVSLFVLILVDVGEW